MKRYEKPTLELTSFSSRENVAASDLYAYQGTTTENIGGTDVPVTVYEIESFRGIS